MNKDQTQKKVKVVKIISTAAKIAESKKYINQNKAKMQNIPKPIKEVINNIPKKMNVTVLSRFDNQKKIAESMRSMYKNKNLPLVKTPSEFKPKITNKPNPNRHFVSNKNKNKNQSITFATLKEPAAEPAVQPAAEPVVNQQPSQ